MPRFFVRDEQINDGIITVVGDDAHHITRVLRLVVGDKIVICDMKLNEYECVLESFGEKVTARIVSSRKINTEPPYSVRLFQALPKGDKLDVIIQKAVECGAVGITPFESERCVVRIKPEAEAKKTERRCRIAHEAAKQCGRGIIPTVTPTLDFNAMLKAAQEFDIILFCYEGDGTTPLPRVLREKAVGVNPRIALIIGSEGGFSQSEAAQAADTGAFMCSLGPRILRTETAGAFALACICSELELR